MKHILLFASALFISFGALAQTCTPNSSYVGSPPGLYPAGPLGPTCELIAPKTIISLTDTLVHVTSPITIDATLYITRMKVNSVTGLPTGLQLSTDAPNVNAVSAPWGIWDNTGTAPNQTSALGCAFVQGDVTAWDNAVGGGANNDGVYPLVFEVDAYVASSDPAFVLGFIGGAQWVSTIDPSVGGGSFFILDTLVVPTGYATITASISGSTNVDPGTQYTYSVANDPSVTYNWTVTNGTIISGQGTNEVVVEWDGSGSIEVDLTEDECTGNDTRSVTANPTGLDEVSGINASVYPNPSNGLFNLQVEKAELLNVRILDISGKQISNEQVSGSTLYTIDMQDAPIGVYILELETAEGKTFKKLIKN